MRMTLRQLAVFVAVAQEGTVTKASDAVKLTQSAASMALAGRAIKKRTSVSDVSLRDV